MKVQYTKPSRTHNGRNNLGTNFEHRNIVHGKTKIIESSTVHVVDKNKCTRYSTVCCITKYCTVQESKHSAKLRDAKKSERS